MPLRVEARTREPDVGLLSRQNGGAASARSSAERTGPWPAADLRRVIFIVVAPWLCAARWASFGRRGRRPKCHAADTSAGDPLKDITELERVTWVMKAGVMWKAP